MENMLRVGRTPPSPQPPSMSALILAFHVPPPDPMELSLLVMPIGWDAYSYIRGG
jgi:hypothetical protein